MSKQNKFFKKYGFYLAISIICVGALIAVFVMPDKKGNIDQAAPYAQNQTAQGEDLQNLPKDDVAIVDEDQLTNTEEAVNPEQEALQSEEIADSTLEENKDQALPDAAAEVADKEDHKTPVDSDKVDQNAASEVKTETFESTTASVSSEPFFAEGDTFAWPVDGTVVVPYTDDSTSHWYSDSLNQTMRTFGICISAEEGTEVKATAKGTVLKVVEDSSTYLDAGMPYVGQLMIIDNGNGYTSIYGFQGGSANEALVGQVVNAGDVLGTVGKPKGAFISQGDNIYLQVTHNDKVINPLNLLESKNTEEKADGVDMGFAK